MTDGWNFADVWEVIAEQIPAAPAQIQGERRLTMSEFDRKADSLAASLVAAGLGHQSKVAQYLYNCPEYLETVFACFKAALVPVNTNYRYGDDELVYLWENADAEAVVFHGCFAERIEGIRDRVPVKCWVWVDDGSGPRPEWAVDYEELTGSDSGRFVASWGRSGDDLYMLYTGGTTGMPKGVMWRQDDLYRLFSQALKTDSDIPDLDSVRSRVTRPGPPGLPACPLMHGTGAFVSFQTMVLGGAVVTLEGRHFNPEELLSAIERERVVALAIVGDAFAKPILLALRENPGRWDISSLKVITSSGVMWSEQTKQGLLEVNPNMVLLDAFSSSEAIGMGQSISTGTEASKTAKFVPGERTRVITEDGRFAEPGEVGLVAIKGPNPLGYYKDPEKTAKTFREIDGERYSIPGDYAELGSDGSLRLLGRGSVCINTGGEKVYPEEVEEVLKEHPLIRDAVVVGVPDERFGEAITALVEVDDAIDAAEIITHVKNRIAHFKAPKHVIEISSIGRSPAGKVDYKALKVVAEKELGAQRER